MARNESYGWHFQYLTILGLFLATLTFTFGFLADIAASPRLFLIKNTLSMTSAPLEVLISALYWGIRSVCALKTLALHTAGSLITRQIDKSLVIPEWMELDAFAGSCPVLFANSSSSLF